MILNNLFVATIHFMSDSQPQLIDLPAIKPYLIRIAPNEEVLQLVYESNQLHHVLYVLTGLML
jgi:hypothetical protein